MSVSESELTSRRFMRLVRGMGGNTELALGTLMLFWHETRKAEQASVHASRLARYFSGSVGGELNLARLFCAAGYLSVEPGVPLEDATFLIVDNDEWFVRAGRRQARARAGGLARAKEKAKAAPRPVLTLPMQAAPAKVTHSQKTAVAPTTAAQAAQRATWEAYARAYESQLGQSPLRNAKANALIKQFCMRVPHAEAPLVIAFYVGHSDGMYRQKLWPLEMAVKDAEPLYTQYKRNFQVTRETVKEYSRREKQQAELDQGVIF